MGVIRTDQWLNEHFDEPLEILKKIDDQIKGEDVQEFYSYLRNFGMYEPNRRCRAIFEQLKKDFYWGKVEKIYQTYRKKWGGPDVPLYIFPFSSNRLFEITNKSGLSFKNMFFLFLTPLEDEKEIEALFVHEYHHVCRMHKQKKELSDYTLLESFVMEGLAEHIVARYCGSKYRASWCTAYSKKEIIFYWQKYLKENLTIKKSEKLHNQLLFGLGRYPTLIGYSTGYALIHSYMRENHFSDIISFQFDAEKFLTEDFLK